MNLEEQLQAAGFGPLVRFLAAELTLMTTKGQFAVFHPRQCLWVKDNRLCLGHPIGMAITFARSEVLSVSGGASIEPSFVGYGGHGLFQRVLED